MTLHPRSRSCARPGSGAGRRQIYEKAWQPPHPAHHAVAAVAVRLACSINGKRRNVINQSDRMRRIAVLMNNAEDDPEGQARAAAFRQGLQALGWTEGKNLRIDWHWTAGDVGRIRGDVTELAAHPPDITVANGRVILSEAVQVIHSIPIVFVLVNDPVGEGFISSLGRPGGNVTGFTFFEYAMFGKSLELLKEVAPAVTRVGFIFNPDASPPLNFCHTRTFVTSSKTRYGQAHQFKDALRAFPQRA